MGILFINAADVKEEYATLVRLVAAHYHPELPEGTDVFQQTLGDVLSEVAMGIKPAVRGACREIWKAAKLLIDRLRGLYCIGSPPYKVILWDADTMCLYV